MFSGEREIRRCIHKIPVIYKGEDKLSVQKMYVKMANKIKIAAMSVTNTDEFTEFYQQNKNSFDDKKAYLHTAYGIVATQYRLERMRYKMLPQIFRTVTVKRSRQKENLHFYSTIRRNQKNCPDVRYSRNINAKIWQDKFWFRGVEFGNWLSNKKSGRQA